MEIKTLVVDRPLPTAVAVWGIGFAVLATVLVGLGLLLTHVFLPAGLNRMDLSVSTWFVRHRTPTLDDATAIGSTLGSTEVIVGVAALAIVVLAVGKHWWHVGSLVMALSLEFAVFLITTLLVDRNRPTVPRLDPSPVTSSFPSGHAAAALALYLSLAVVVMSFIRSTLARVLVWVLAVALPLFVAVSRVYRGMHHVTDVSASLLLGVGAVLFSLLATRSALAPSAAPDTDTVSEPSPWPPVGVAS